MSQVSNSEKSIACKRTASAKALRQESAWHSQGTETVHCGWYVVTDTERGRF